ncbi:MAG TPA: alpha/beta hydrolase [Phototrophicaceae bacterium]|jgi:pimeloyl-ACP methyl ester carboxylesterase|nr:alpha/beta hydrolase [Phototrophicaceae bacterium]
MSFKPSHLFTMFFLFVCLLALSLSTLAQDEQESTPPFVEWTACPFEIPEGETEGDSLDCGTLVTYEDHFSDQGEAQVEIAFAILYSNNETSTDPVIYLEGGPGGSALSAVDDWSESNVREHNDLILVDQRGTGFSLPSLNCIEVENDEGDDPLVAQQACYDRMVAEGIDLNAYNSAQSAADIADLMTLLQDPEEELNYTAYNLLGISYGTRLALTIIRDHPENVRSAIIDSVYPPNVDVYEQEAVDSYRGLRMLFDGCNADPDCANAYPDLESVFYDTYDSLNGTPATYESTDPDTGDVSDQELTGDSFLDLIIQSLYSTSAIPELPLVIYEVSEGNYGIVDQIDTGEIAGRAAHRQDTGDDEGDISDSEGMFNAVECKEELPFNNLDEAVAASVSIPDPIHDYLVSSIEDQLAVCDIYGLEPADAIETQPVTSDIPTLVLSGDYDPITPPSDAQIAAETLSNSYYFEFPGHGHGITDSDDCATTVVAQFLADPTVEPDGSCIADLGGPAFVIR